MSIHRPRAVVFDIGNVLLDFSYGKTVDRIKSRCKMNEAELRELFGACDLFNRFESGELDSAGYFAEILNRTCFDGTLEEFGEMFGDIFTEVPEMVAWHEELRQRDIPTFILSNTNELSIRWIRQSYPFFKHFTGYVFSHEVGAMKPAARIYEAIEDMAKLRGPDLFYMDDREENVQGAAARGWQAVHHARPAQTIEIARSLGL